MRILFVALLALLLGTTPIMAKRLPSVVTQCVQETAESIQNAESAHDMIQQLQGKIQEHILGSRSYRVNWPKIQKLGRARMAIVHYLETLYTHAIKKSRAYEGEKKTVRVGRLDRNPYFLKNSYDEGDEEAPSYPVYEIQVQISTPSMKRPTTVIVLVMLEAGTCKFGDISLIARSTQIWWSNEVSSSNVLK